MGGVLGGFAAGLAQGVASGLVRKQQQDREDEERKRRQQHEDEDRALLRETRDIQLKRLRQEDSDQLALRNAGAPATVTEQGALPNGLQYPSNEDADAAVAGQPNAPMPEVPRFRVETGQGVQRFDTREQADANAGQYNSPVALTQRLTQTLSAQGKPVEALKLSKEADDYVQQHWQRELGQAMMGGHEGIAQMINSSEAGPFKGKQVKPVPSPDGKTVTYSVVNPDGSTTPTNFTFPADQNGVAMAGFMLDRTIKPMDRYKFMVENDRKNADAERKLRDLEEVKIPLAEARGTAAQASAAAAEARAEASLARANAAGSAGSSKIDAEDRKRWTSLHSEAGRQLTESRKRLAQLQGDMLFMSRAKKPGTPEAAQLEQLQQDMETYRQDRELYGGLLGGKAASDAREQRAAAPAGAKPATQAPAAPAKGGKVAAPKTKAEYDALPPGTKYQHPNDPPGRYRTKK